MNEHFDGILKDDDRSPGGFKEVAGVVSVVINPNTGRLVITGSQPNDTHHCDMRGCGSFEHKIAEFEIDKEVLEPIRNATMEEEP